MKVEICYNRNIACYNRGTESDEPNRKETFEFGDFNEFADFLANDNDFGIYVDEDKLNSKTVEFKDIIDACNNIDISGGDTVVFWIDINDGEEFWGTKWQSDESEWDFDEEDDDSCEDDYGCDLDDPLEFTLSAVLRAFSFEYVDAENEQGKAAWTIARWYYDEGSCEDFEIGSEEGVTEFADYIQSDIENMIDAADESGKKDLVLKVLGEKGFIDPAIWNNEE